mgnify:CR=1 FL=1
MTREDSAALVDILILDEAGNIGINPDLISISKNSSVYNNDYLRNRLENFPLIDLNFKLDLEEYNKLRTYTRGIENFNNDTAENGLSRSDSSPAVMEMASSSNMADTSSTSSSHLHMVGGQLLTALRS